MTRSLPDALASLYQLAPRGARLGLERVRAAAVALGNLHEVGPYVHIAGTNGKGSTAAFVAEMAKRAGKNVGLYTSPHLCRFAERICLNGEPISDDLLAFCLEEVLRVSDELTFFEVATLTALLAFREAKVDLHVLEVGIGGRLDATNIAQGKAVTVITRIAFDHTDRLGNTITAIAREKAGVLRPEAPCITGRLHPDARAVINDVAEPLGVAVYEATTAQESQLLSLYPPSLPGSYQHSNAMIAVATARHLGLPDEAIGAGLGATHWPGRFEVLETTEGYVVIDSAHNPDGALALKNSLLGVGTTLSRRQIALVFGSMADKNWRAMLDRLSSVMGPRVYLEPRGRAAVPAKELADYLPGHVAFNVDEALSFARQQVGRGGLIVIAGSLFLAGQVRAHLLNLPLDPPVGL